MSDYKFPSSRVSNGALKETILCGILQLLAFIAVGLRLWSRRLTRKRLEFNDHAIFAALFLTSGLLAIAITSTVWSGKGFHTHDIAPEYRSRVFVAFTAGQPTWGAANTAVKFSILHLYLVLFQDTRFRRICYVMMTLSACYFISVFLETFLVCKPVQFNWNKTIEGTCDSNALEVYLAAGIINLIIDVLIFVMPMPNLFRLTMPTGKKVGLIAVFGVGGVICVVSLLRVLYISRMDIHDFHYTYADLGMWSIVEPQLGIVNACMPVMRGPLQLIPKSRLYQKLFPSRWSKVSSPKVSPSPAPVLGGSGGRNAPIDPYPLDTIHLVGKVHNSIIDSGVDVERQ